MHFEKIESLKWPYENWTLLLQSVLIGKARDVCTHLSVGQSSSYETVKEMILKCLRHTGNNLEIVGKNLIKLTLNLQGLKNSYLINGVLRRRLVMILIKIRQLLLIEEFKWGLSNEIKTYLSEQKVDTLDNAAWLAEDYSLTHKVTFV